MNQSNNNSLIDIMSQEDFHNLDNLFRHLANEIYLLHQKSDFYFSLFSTSHQRVELIKECVPLELGYFQRLIRDDIYLSICRLLDKARTGGQDNSSLDKFLSLLPDQNSSEFKNQIDEVIESLKNKSKDIKTHRDKRISHNGLEVAQGLNPFHDIQYQTVRDILKIFLKFLDLCFKNIDNAYRPPYNSPDWSKANALMETLQFAKEYKKLVKNGKIEPPKNY